MAPTNDSPGRSDIRRKKNRRKGIKVSGVAGTALVPTTVQPWFLPLSSKSMSMLDGGYSMEFLTDAALDKD